MLNIEEEYVDLSLAISNSSTNMQRRHSSNFSKLKEDEVSVLHIPHINDTSRFACNCLEVITRTSFLLT